MRTDYDDPFELKVITSTLEEAFSTEVALSFLRHIEEGKALVEILESDPNNEEAKKKAEALAEETGFNFWYEKAVVNDGDYDDCIWQIYQPKSANIDAMNALIEDVQTFVQYHHTPGVWEHSHSC